MMAVNQLIQKLFRGCQMEGETTQLMILMRKISSEYYHGDMSDEELKSSLTQICRVISAQLAGCGKDYAIDQCVIDFQSALGQSVSDGIYRQFLNDLTKKKQKKQPSGSSIF